YQTILGSNENGVLKLAPKVDTENTRQVTSSLDSNRLIRQLYSLRSPSAMMRAGMREGIGMGEEAGMFGDEAGMAGMAGMAGALVPLISFVVLPQIQNLIQKFIDNYMQTQMLKNQRIWNNQQQQQYRKAFRSIIPA